MIKRFKEKLGLNKTEDLSEKLEEIEEELKAKRHLEGWWRIPVVAASLGLFVFHMYTGWFGSLFALLQRIIHYTLILTIVFAIYAPSKKSRRDRIPIYDFIIIFVAIYLAYYLITNIEELVWRVGAPTTMDVILGIIMILITLEATRRAVGLPIVIVVCLFLLYALVLGPYMPGRLKHGNFPIEDIAFYLYLTDNGILGIPLGVSANFIYLFILFGAILFETGAAKFFIDFAIALTGFSRGGPAKAAIVSSAAMGMVSGSSTANTVTTGSFTIPLMKRVGYPATFAGAVEPVASTAGQIMPPIMGAAAFIMAEFLGVPYIKVAMAAVLPAIFYYLALFLAVDFKAAKIGLKGVSRDELPNLKEVVVNGGFLLIPVFGLIYLLVKGYSPQKSVVLSIILLLIVCNLRKETRLTPRKLLKAIVNAGVSAAPVAVACAAAGIIVGIVTRTGLGLKFTSIVLSASMGYLPLALILASLASLLLGMGVPTTANYIIMATLVAPALIKFLGEAIAPIVPHMFVFYYGILADITPPVMLAVFAGAAIAKSDPMKTGFEAVKLALPGYAIPFFMVYHPDLISWPFQEFSFGQFIYHLVLGVVLTISIAGAMQGHLLRNLKLPERLLLFVSVLLIILPEMETDILGVVILIAMILFLKLHRQAV